MKPLFGFLSNLGLLDLKYQDFSNRHLFTTKIRILIFVGFWFLCLTYFPDLLSVDEPIMLLISLTFLSTTIGYYFIMKGTWPFFFFLQEIIADLFAQTVIVYVTGGMSSNFFTLYILYALVDGAFYNYRVSFLICFFAAIFYAGMWFLLKTGLLVPFQYVFHGSTFGILEFTDAQRFTVLVICLLVASYGAKIANHFAKLREIALAERNQELEALNKIASTIRGVLLLENVVKEILLWARKGLGYDQCLFLQVDAARKRVRIFLPEDADYVRYISSHYGIDLNQAYLPLESEEPNAALEAIRRREILIREDLYSVVRGMKPVVKEEVVEDIQRHFGFKKLIIAPMVTEARVTGAVIGVTRREWVGEETLRTMDRFANQAALAIDNVTMIEQLKSKNKELERVSQIKSEFLATMSHELRTPLTAIIGFSELLMEEVMGELSTEQKESMKEVLNNGEHLLQLINSLLDLAKIEAGKMELIRDHFSLGELVESTVKAINPLILKKRQKLAVKVGSEMPPIYADSKRIQQILFNLLSNAIKFTPEGGKIKVEASFCENLDALKVIKGLRIEEGFYKSGYFQMVVEDTGIGIQKKDMDHIFQMFTQVDRSYSRSYSGTGLGLALIEQFIDLHQGRVWVESEYGQGSKFFVILPHSAPSDGKKL